MPARFALVAAAGAATGAIATAFFYSGQAQKRTNTPPVPSSSPATLASPSGPAGVGALGGRRSGGGDVVSPVDPAGLFAYGFPGPINDLAHRKALVSVYDRRTRNPIWVAEHITPHSLSLKEGDRRSSVFLEDEAIPTAFRGKLKDYFRSGYDRGHQVPAADAKFSQEAINETFYLSNMCPQVGEGFNRDYWAHLEDFCRRLTTHYPSVRIVTGPLYLPKLDPATGKYVVSYEVIGSPPNIAVPTHFFKVIVAELEAPATPTSPPSNSAPIAVAAFVLPNAKINNAAKLEEFEVPLEAVERASGLEFLTKVEPGRRRRLCREVECSITARVFADAVAANRKQIPGPLGGKY